MSLHVAQPIDRRGTNSLKWTPVADSDVLPFWVADMDFPSPDCVVEAIQARSAHPTYGYTLAPDALGEVIQERFSSLYDTPIERSWLYWLPGVVPTLSALCLAFSDPGDEVLTFTPIYPPFLQLPGELGRKCVSIPLQYRANRWVPDVVAFEQALTPRSRIFFLCQPHNPVGQVFTRAELEPILNLCMERNILIVSDDIHCDLILNGEPHRPVMGWSEALAQHVITLMSPGKTFNTAGLNMAFAVLPNARLRAEFTRFCRHLLPHPNALALTAALAAYRDGEPWRLALLSYLRENAQLVLDWSRAQGGRVHMDPVEATYLAWMDFSAMEWPNPVQRLRQHGVLLSNGADFGAPGFLRMNFGCPRSLLEQGLERMSRASKSNSGHACF